MPRTPTEKLERHVLLLMAMVQFINIWDFMIVMPLGPDFAKALGIDAGHIGWIAGSYSISAAAVGVLSARFLDRFDRRSVLLFNLTGLMVATFSMVFATTLPQLIATRMITGMFGGQAIASSLAVIADVFPENRRGEAMGKVFGSFSIASIIGVPLALEIANLFGWWAPFVAVSLMAAVTLATIRYYLPPMRHHLDQVNPARLNLFSSLRHNPAALPAALLTAFATFSIFLIVPNISAHVQQNMGYPRASLGLLYFCGGMTAFFSMRLIGKISDRVGYAKSYLYASMVLGVAVYIGFYAQLHSVPVLLVFIFFMVSSAIRNVVGNALISKIPKPEERAGFMSLISSVQNLMSGLGAMCSTLLLVETPEGKLAGMDTLSLIALIVFAFAPPMMFRIEKAISKRKVVLPVEPIAV